MVFLSSTTVDTSFPLIATILSRLYRLVPPGEIESGLNLPGLYHSPPNFSWFEHEPLIVL